MGCELNLTGVDIAGLISFLIAEKDVESFSPDDTKSPAEMKAVLGLSEVVDESRPYVRVFGNDYQEVHRNARDHVRGCESCRQDYKAKILAVAGMIDISKRGSEGSEDAGSLDEDLMELDREFLGILYEEE